jgi:pimeloyl-ACP methyl ester carboxylesterase
VVWFWIGLGVLGVILLLLAVGWVALFYHIKTKFLPQVVRIFQEKPLFIIPRGQRIEDAEEVTFLTPQGLKLAGCYLKTTCPQRRGVILFGLEFGSNRWACIPYTQFLREAGYDVFTFEPRSQGDSDSQPGYDPLQWVTNFEVSDFQTALAYLKGRHDADPRGIGFFGISKGGGAGIMAAVADPYVRCLVTDGIFAAYTTMVPYMRKWIGIYSHRKWLFDLVPTWYFGMFAQIGLHLIEKERACQFPHLELYLARLTPRPLLMIHGGADTYIKPEMAETLFHRAREPRELWIVDGAKHNQSFHTARQDYERRVLTFFQAHLNDGPTTPAPAGNGSNQRTDTAPATAGKPG